MNKKFRYTGQSIPRRDAIDIVCGRTTFLNDIRFPNLLNGKVLRSPHAHAIIRCVHKDKAAKLPGVKAVIAWDDCPDWRSGTPRCVRILDRKVRYVGDAVALVAATSERIAEEALSLIEVEYDVLPPVFDVEEAIRPNAPELYVEFPRNIMPAEAPILGQQTLTELVMGDVNKGLNEADVIAEGEFRYENIPNPIPPEPPGAVALWEKPNKITLWVVSQFPKLDQIVLSHILGRNVEVRTHGGPCGGSYGSRALSWQVQTYATLLSRATGNPVKVFFSKEEHLASFTLRLGSRMQGKIGMKKDGTVTAISARWLVDTGYYSMTTQFMVAVACGEAQLVARCANWDLKPTIVCTNRNASGSVRGFGGQELKSALVPLLCLAMEKAELDPFEVLKKNYVKPGDEYKWRDARWYRYRGVDYSKAMDKGAALFRWKEKWKGWLRPTSIRNSKRIGVGVGIHGNADIGEDSSEVYVYLRSDGSALINSSVTEHGTGQRSNYMKMVAEVLQLPLEHVTMTPSDSLFNPYEFGPVGSRGTYAIGSAMIAAAEDAKRKLFEIMAPMLSSDPSELETVDGSVHLKSDPKRKLPWKAIGFSRTVTGYGRFDPDYSLVNCMMTFVEVEVDIQTGKVELLRVVNATDVGKIIDPDGIEGQINGCFGSSGIDSAIFEETILDHRTGHMLNANLIDYKWRTFNEMPAINNVVLETPFPSHRFKAVGVGEISTAPGPSAVLMAVSNAVGAWIHDYPVTPPKVLEAVGRASKRVKEVPA